MTLPTAARAWRPLLTTGLADRATEIVREIAEALLERSFDEPGEIAGGAAGIAVFHAYVARTDRGGPYEASSRRYLESAVATLAETRMRPDLYGGFTGIAWTVEHLMSSASQAIEDDPNESIDEALEAGLREANGSATWWRRWELMTGLAGFGIYALERLPRPSAKRNLELIVSHLAAVSERAADGITWFASPELLPPLTRQRMPNGAYNLGVAHGVPGVIGFLGQVCAAGIAERQARELLDGAVSWLLARRLPRGGGAAFAMWIAPDGSPLAGRVSWCYGNPGIAVALLIAARAVGEKRWEEEALDLALESAAQGIRESGVIEACLCHGSAGNAHLFNRLFQATGDERFRDAAVAWFERTLEFHKPGSGLAGFESRVLVADGEVVWKGEPGFLMGIAGVGLALLAATTAVEPAWDRVFLSSLPPQR
jgi:lantibiotic modifying enzyme